MKTNLLKLQRHCPLLFDILYGHILQRRTNIRLADRVRKRLFIMADDCWGWEDYRETYDACIIAANYLQEMINEYKDETD